MRISIEATRQDIVPALDWIGGLIGGALDTNVAALKQQEKNNPVLSQYMNENYALEFALASARKYRRNTGRIPKGHEFDSLYGFLIPAHRIHQALPSEAKKPFEGQLTKAASDPSGLRPFAYELGIASHLMGRGWDVDFSDYCGHARFDFLARKGSTEIEVECKATSNDRGRKIHRQEAVRLADFILPTTKRLAETPGCHLVRITVPDRLGSSHQELSSIATLVASVVERRTSTENMSARAEYTQTDLASWPEPNSPDFRQFFEKQLGLPNSNLLFCGRPGLSVVAVGIVSAKPDSVIKSIAAQAKDAADQCSGTRPAMIAMNLAGELDREELEELLRTPSGIHEIAGAVFQSDKRKHIDSIAFTVPQRMRSDASATFMSGDLIRLDNPQPKFICPEIRSIFRPNSP